MNEKLVFSIFMICIFIHLLVGNSILMTLYLPVIYHLLISLSVCAIYGVAFYKINNREKAFAKRQQIFISIGLSLSGMLVACIFSSIGIRLETDTIITAALKGVIPIFVFCVVLVSPIWLPLALVNFICIYFIEKDKKPLRQG